MVTINNDVRPAVKFKIASPKKSNPVNNGSVVAIIGAFPCVTKEILTFDTLEKAYAGLGVVAGVHDEQYVYNSRGELELNNNYYYGAGALKQAFLGGTDLNGASEVIICNISTYKLQSNGDPECEADGTTPKYNTTLTHETNVNGPNYATYEALGFDKLKVAFAKLKKEDFNNLILAYPLENEATGTITDGLDTGIKRRIEQYLDWTRDSVSIRHPCAGYFALSLPKQTSTTTTTTPAAQSNETSGENDGEGESTGAGDVTTTTEVTVTTEESVVDSVVDTLYSSYIDVDTAIKYLELFADDIFSLGAMRFTGMDVKSSNYTLNPVEGVSYICGNIAGSSVDTTFTQRVLEGVTGLVEELNYDPSLTVTPDGFKLIEAGATMLECTNRAANEYSVVTSRLPCGYDIAHVRTSAYIINQLQLNPALGAINYDTNLEIIDGMVGSILDTCTSQFPIVQSIDYEVEKVSAKCIDVTINIHFYDIIITETVNVNIDIVEN